MTPPTTAPSRKTVGWKEAEELQDEGWRIQSAFLITDSASFPHIPDEVACRMVRS